MMRLRCPMFGIVDLKVELYSPVTVDIRQAITQKKFKGLVVSSTPDLTYLIHKIKTTDCCVRNRHGDVAQCFVL